MKDYFLVIVDKGYEQIPLDMCKFEWQAEKRLKEYQLGWKMTEYGQYARILKITVTEEIYPSSATTLPDISEKRTSDA